MPVGLTSQIREDEFVDLVRFMSELGKEGNLPPLLKGLFAHGRSFLRVVHKELFIIMDSRS